MEEIDISNHFDNFGTFNWEVFYITSFVAGILSLASTNYPLMNTLANVAVLLFFLTVGAKQIMKISPSTNETLWRPKLNLMIEFLLFFSVLYFSLVLSEGLNSFLKSFSALNVGFEAILIFLMFIIPIAVILVLDILFKDLMAYYSLKLYNGVVSDDNPITTSLASVARKGFESSSKSSDEYLEVEQSSMIDRLILYFVIVVVAIILSFVPYLLFGNIFVTLAFVISCYIAKGAITLPYYLYGESDYMELKRMGLRKYINLFIPIIGLIFIMSL